MMNSNIGNGAHHDLRSIQRNWPTQRNSCLGREYAINLYKTARIKYATIPHPPAFTPYAVIMTILQNSPETNPRKTR